MKFRRLYDGAGGCEFVDTDSMSNETGAFNNEPSLALQSAKDEADINTIVKRFGLTGQVPQGFRMPVYADFVNLPDTYQGALEMVRRAEDAFLKVPPQIRARFNNDPGEFIAFCEDPANLPEMKKMGLAIDIPKESATITPKPGDGPQA